MFKKVAIFILAILFLAGCSANTPSPTGSLVATPNVSSVDSIALTQATAMPSPSLSPTPTISPMQEKFDLAPELEGLNKEIREKDGIEKVVYLYEADNPYGGVEGEYAGEFKKDVFITGVNEGAAFKKEIGGIVMTPEVVRELIKTTSEEIHNAVMPMPVDISVLGSEDVVMSTENILGDYPYAIDNVVIKIEIEGDASVDMVCVSLEEDSTYRLFSDEYYGFKIENSYAGSSEWADKRRDDSNISEEEWSSFLSFMGNIDTRYYNDGISAEVNYGDIIGKITSPVYMFMDYMSGLERASFHNFLYKTGDERIYIPVFITAKG
jgi:hypothetical protein